MLVSAGAGGVGVAGVSGVAGISGVISGGVVEAGVSGSDEDGVGVVVSEGREELLVDVVASLSVEVVVSVGGGVTWPLPPFEGVGVVSVPPDDRPAVI